MIFVLFKSSCAVTLCSAKVYSSRVLPEVPSSGGEGGSKSLSHSPPPPLPRQELWKQYVVGRNLVASNMSSGPIVHLKVESSCYINKNLEANILNSLPCPSRNRGKNVKFKARSKLKFRENRLVE